MRPSRTHSCPLRLPASLSSLRLGCLADPLSFGHGQTANARLGAPECPQPRVDLVNMASFTRSKAWTISATAFKGHLLSVGVLVRNSRGGIAFQKALNDRYPSKKVLNPSNKERGNRGGLVQFSHSIGLHCASQVQVQILKGAEEDQVKCNVQPDQIRPLQA